MFVPNLLAIRQACFRAPPEFEDRLAGFHPLHGADDDLALFAEILLIDGVAFCFAQPLEHHLLRRLRGDAPGVFRDAHLEIKHIAFGCVRLIPLGRIDGDLDVRLFHLFNDGLLHIGVDFAGFRVHLHVDIRRVFAFLAVRRTQGGFNRLEHDFLGEVLFGRQLANREEKVVLHRPHKKSGPRAHSLRNASAGSIARDSRRGIIVFAIWHGPFAQASSVGNMLAISRP